jgi:transposase
MKALHRRCAGLDVHQQEIVACRRIVAGRKVQTEVGRFSATTQGLLELADWLEDGKVTHVAMEATGVYWKPVWHVLHGRFTLILANAAHIRNVPGRKSDVNDATWIAELLAHGLIRASFVPPPRQSHPRTRLPSGHPPGSVIPLDVDLLAHGFITAVLRPAKRPSGSDMSSDDNAAFFEQ